MSCPLTARRRILQSLDEEHVVRQVRAHGRVVAVHDVVECSAAARIR